MDFAKVTIDFGATTQDFHLGRASVAVPGNLKGFLHAHRRLGRLPLQEGKRDLTELDLLVLQHEQADFARDAARFTDALEAGHRGHLHGYRETHVCRYLSP